MRTTRRGLLIGAGAAALLAGGGIVAGLASRRGKIALAAERRVIEVNGRAATVGALRQPDGTLGARFRAGDRFRATLSNRMVEPTLIHWHGLRPPVEQDGVPDLSQPLLAPGDAYDYDFALREPGTFWMHSHHGLQLQGLLAAPLIIAEDDGADEQEVVLMLHDFSVRAPAEILADLKAGIMPGMGAMPGMPGMDHSAPAGQSAEAGSDLGMPGMDHGAPAGHGAEAAPDLNEVEFDAYLANDRTLADPELVAVERGGRVRLRVINGASSTNFVLDLGVLEGELIAVDGRPVLPVRGRRFGIAMSQRLDLRLRLDAAGAFPVLAIREGDRRATGLVLRTPGAAVARISESVPMAAEPLSFAEEQALRPRDGLPERPVDRRLAIALTGGMAPYVWGLDGAGPEAMREYPVAAGERVEITLDNRTTMSHPMHLHGHVFQVVGGNGARFAGALRDTVLVPYRGNVTIAFDADNPGAWMLHCHNLYHMEAGMRAVLRYG